MEVESRIAEVTLYAHGARVRRVMTIASRAPRVRVVGLPLAAIDDTVRVEAEGAVVTAVHVGLDAPPAAAAADEDTPEVRAARRSAALAEAEIERLNAALTALATTPVVPAERSEPQGAAEPPPAWGAVVEARRALVTLRTARELALREQIAAARRVAEDARRALSAALDRDRRAGSARPARLHELRKHVELELEVDLARAGEADPAGGGATVHLEYQVAAARWAPSYVARLDGERVVLELRAAIAQATGEDWTAVAIRLSTAEPEQFGALPELAAQRIGRRQAEPPRAGFRAPPGGAAALYHDYLQSFAEPRARQVTKTEPLPAGPVFADGMAPQSRDEGSSRAKQANAALPKGGLLKSAPAAPPASFPPAPPPAMQPQPLFGGAPAAAAAPMQAEAFDDTAEPVVVQALSASVRRSRVVAGPAAPGGGGGGAAPSPAAAMPAAAAPPRLDYSNLRMAPPGFAERGRLIPAPQDPRLVAPAAEVAAAAARIDALALPVGCRAEWPHTYDYAFATDGAVDVRSDAGWHAIAVTAKPTEVALRHVAVPRVQADAFRIAAIVNPLAGPLLPGPIDVYDRGRFLVTSAVEHTPPGGRVEIGLGVDPQVKLARNTEFREETTGVLRGGLRLHHAIAIDVDNLSERAIDLEVRERLPVTRDDDKDVDVAVGRVEPPWERWTPEPDAPGEPRLRGGHRWRLAIPARTKRTLRAAYEIKIAGKLELVGGNRRES